MSERPGSGLQFAGSSDLGPGDMHYRAVVTYEKHLDKWMRDHPGKWVAIKDEQVLGISENRHELLDKFHNENYVPILIRQVPRQ